VDGFLFADTHTHVLFETVVVLLFCGGWGADVTDRVARWLGKATGGAMSAFGLYGVA